MSTKTEPYTCIANMWLIMKNPNFSYSSQRWPMVSIETCWVYFSWNSFLTHQKITYPLRCHIWPKTCKIKWLIPYHKLHSVQFAPQWHSSLSLEMYCWGVFKFTTSCLESLKFASSKFLSMHTFSSGKFTTR